MSLHIVLGDTILERVNLAAVRSRYPRVLRYLYSTVKNTDNFLKPALLCNDSELLREILNNTSESYITSMTNDITVDIYLRMYSVANDNTRKILYRLKITPGVYVKLLNTYGADNVLQDIIRLNNICHRNISLELLKRVSVELLPQVLLIYTRSKNPLCKSELGTLVSRIGFIELLQMMKLTGCDHYIDPMNETIKEYLG